MKDKTTIPTYTNYYKRQQQQQIIKSKKIVDTSFDSQTHTKKKAKLKKEVQYLRHFLI